MDLKSEDVNDIFRILAITHYEAHCDEPKYLLPTGAALSQGPLKHINDYQSSFRLSECDSESEDLK